MQMSVVNYFLNNFVFPRHARTFERKLVTSGWDIASLAPDKVQHGGAITKTIGSSDRKASLTVGFSGTNDNRTLLPLNIQQDDLPSLAHTNAEVLTYLLQKRNSRYHLSADERGRRLTEKAFLYQIKKRGIRMLLDAGAQIIESDNITLARMWLEVDSDPDAAVYFAENGQAWVLYRDGRGQPFAASPYLNNLAACCVYLDEAHTRGVDLKMPSNARAALTLGMGQTKDHTVQGKRAIFPFVLVLGSDTDRRPKRLCDCANLQLPSLSSSLRLPRSIKAFSIYGRSRSQTGLAPQMSSSGS